MKITKEGMRQRRKMRIRKKISGTPERPRMVVFRSNCYFYVQVIDDVTGQTLASASSLKLSRTEPVRMNKETAANVGKEIARLAKEKNIDQVVFDRNGYAYHGRVKALADAAREAGLNF